MAFRNTKILSTLVLGIGVMFISVATGLIPFPLKGELENGLGITAPNFVWGASTGFSDYVATYTFVADRPWAFQTAAANGFSYEGRDSQHTCIGDIGIPWWVQRKDKALGECWKKDNYSEWGRTQRLFFDDAESRIVVFVYEE